LKTMNLAPGFSVSNDGNLHNTTRYQGWDLIKVVQQWYNSDLITKVLARAKKTLYD